MIFNTGKNVEQLTVAAVGIVGTIRGEVGNSQLVREAEQRLVYVFLRAQMMERERLWRIQSWRVVLLGSLGLIGNLISLSLFCP